MFPGAGERAKTREYNLDTIQYRVDRANLYLYNRITGAHFKTHTTTNNKDPRVHWMRWDTFVKAGNAFRVPPEILVDENYYITRSGWAPYRLVFAAARRGLKPSDFLVRHTPAEKAAWYYFLKGSPVPYLRIGLAELQRACRQAGIPLSYLFVSLRRVETASVFATLHNVLQVLTEKDAAFLAGVAKVLSGRPDEERLSAQLGELVKWYGRSDEGKRGSHQVRRQSSSTDAERPAE